MANPGVLALITRHMEHDYGHPRKTGTLASTPASYTCIQLYGGNMISLRTSFVAGAIAAGTLFGTFFFNAEPAEACLHPAREFKYPIKAGAQKGLIFFADGRQTMVLRPSFTVEGEGLTVKNDAVEGFTTIAWLVPTPNLPEGYKEADAKLFSELDEFTEAEEREMRNSMKELKGDWDGRAEEDGMTMHEEVKVGDYTIQPIKAKGELGQLELNNWLKNSGFAEVSADVLKYYTDKDYYWLAIKLENPKGLPANGEVKPLQLSFATDKPVYPIKVNHGTGEFDLELWVICGRELDTEKTKAFGLKTVEQQDGLMQQNNRKTRFSRLPGVVKDVAKDDEGLKNLKAGDLYCYRFFGTGLGKDVDLGKLEHDLSFSFKEVPKD